MKHYTLKILEIMKILGVTSENDTVGLEKSDEN